MNPKIVIVGAGGRLGAALLREFGDELDVVGFNHAQLDLAAPDEMRRMLTQQNFDLLINCAALTDVDYCETHRDEAFLVNAEASRVLAEICQSRGAKLVHISTDYVFDGQKSEPYTEEDPAQPISVYGESKREGERRVLATSDRHLVLRVSWVFGPDRPTFVDNLLKLARKNENVAAVADKFSTPTYTKDIAEMLRHVVAGVADPGWTAAGDRGWNKDRGYDGILHFTNGGACSWQVWAQHALDCCRKAGMPLKAERVDALSLAEMKNFVAKRPVYTVLSTAKFRAVSGAQPRDWRAAVAEYVENYVVKK